MFSGGEATLVSDGLASIDTPPLAAAAALDAAGASALAGWDMLEVMGVLYNTQHTGTKAIRPYRVHSPLVRKIQDVRPKPWWKISP